MLTFGPKVLIRICEASSTAADVILQHGAANALSKRAADWHLVLHENVYSIGEGCAKSGSRLPLSISCAALIVSPDRTPVGHDVNAAFADACLFSAASRWPLLCFRIGYTQSSLPLVYCTIEAACSAAVSEILLCSLAVFEGLVKGYPRHGRKRHARRAAGNRDGYRSGISYHLGWLTIVDPLLYSASSAVYG